jgi:hypothetical protein
MACGEVEFLGEPEPEPEPPVAGGAPPSRRARVLLLAATAGFLGAAALAVVAPFRAVYTVGTKRAPGPRYADYLAEMSSVRAGVDGWGRDTVTAGASNGIRFGIALCACAAMLLVLAGLTAARAYRAAFWSGHGAERVLFAGSLAVPCLLAGVVAALGLLVQSALAQSFGWVANVPIGPGRPPPVPSVQAGACWWLSVAALACAVLAAVLVGLARRAERGS